jgi:hypothetical protein
MKKIFKINIFTIGSACFFPVLNLSAKSPIEKAPAIGAFV